MLQWLILQVLPGSAETLELAAIFGMLSHVPTVEALLSHG